MEWPAALLELPDVRLLIDEGPLPLSASNIAAKTSVPGWLAPG
jgi:hypothetical protein